jgi:hypothetical protein
MAITIADTQLFSIIPLDCGGIQLPSIDDRDRGGIDGAHAC